MRTNHAVASIGLGLLLTACGSPGGTAQPSDTRSVPATDSPSPAVAGCSPSHPMPSGEMVKLYFPCGAATDLHPVERSTSATGEDAIAEVVRLFLAGPNAQERLAGFSSLLSPGDVVIAEIHAGRLVLDFPMEVNNVSTSTGSRNVLDGLRMTLLGLEGVDEIELRLRDDCAAFFEWIQVGPACHVLTDAGLVPGPSPSPSPVAASPPPGYVSVEGLPITVLANDEADALFGEVDTCASEAGYTVTFPASWYTNPATDGVPACAWFAPEPFDASMRRVATNPPPPDGVWISMGVADGGVGYTSVTPTCMTEDLSIGGYHGHRAEVGPSTLDEIAARPDYRAYHYVIPFEEFGPTFVAGTDVDMADEYPLSKAVLDRVIATISFDR